jgi:hypothetical protein
MVYLIEFVAALFGWLAAKVGRVAAVISLTITALSGLWLAVNLVFDTVTVHVMGILSSHPLMYDFWMGVSLVIPADFKICIGIMLSADVAVFLYRVYRRVIDVSLVA